MHEAVVSLRSSARALAFTFGLCVVPAVLHCQQRTIDVLCLKNKTVVRGSIRPESGKPPIVVIRTMDGPELRIARSDIQRIAEVSGENSVGDYSLCWRKQPAGAWLSSFIVPGAGQAYNKQWAKGVGFAAVWAAGFALYLGNDQECYQHNLNCTTRDIGQGLALVSWIGAQVDAPLRSLAINRRNGESPHLRDPGLVLVLSAVAPGAGQGYNGDWAKAAAFAGAFTLGMVLSSTNANDCADRDQHCGLATVGGALWIVTYIGAMMESSIRAVQLNRGRGLALDLGPQLHPLGVSLASLRF